MTPNRRPILRMARWIRVPTCSPVWPKVNDMRSPIIDEIGCPATSENVVADIWNNLAVFERALRAVHAAYSKCKDRQDRMDLLLWTELKVRIAKEIMSAGGDKREGARRVVHSLDKALEEARELANTGTIGLSRNPSNDFTISRGRRIKRPLSRSDQPIGLIETWFEMAAAWRERCPRPDGIGDNTQPDQVPPGAFNAESYI